MEGQGIFGVIFEVALVLLSAVTLVTLVTLTLVYVERKVAAHFQCRLGPMRVGFHGILQTVADALKLLFKETPTPTGADKILFNLSPTIPFTAGITLLALLPIPMMVPFPVDGIIADLNAGVLFVMAISSVGVIGIIIGGWGSNNKYSLLGGMRMAAQIISYELSASFALLVVVILQGSLHFGTIVEAQAEGWWIWRGHLPAFIAFVMFTISSTAECNRTPFDLAEGESELTGGFHTEFGGMRFAMFFLAEFINVFVFAILSATMFFGGWMPLHIPGLDGFNNVMALIPGKLWFIAKTSALVFLTMWFRWTFPRLRIDQLMKLEWKFLLPLGLANIVLAAIVKVYGYHW